MKSFGKRLGALESSRANSVTSGINLDALTDAELDRLMEIVIKFEDGLPADNLPDDDQCFVDGLRAIS